MTINSDPRYHALRRRRDSAHAELCRSQASLIRQYESMLMDLDEVRLAHEELQIALDCIADGRVVEDHDDAA